MNTILLILLGIPTILLYTIYRFECRGYWTLNEVVYLMIGWWIVVGIYAVKDVFEVLL